MAMAEAAATAAAPCLMRSVSQPVFASREFKEGDPLRALTTSVSFGRFMNEPLDWARWSSFSHNRIREDVQKHSRPGAVAEKKAFFEAYFNRFASKKTAKPPKKENRPPNYSPQTHVSPVTISDNKENQSPTVATYENMHNKGSESEITSNQDVSSPSPILVLPKTENVDAIISSGGQMEQEKTSTENVSSPIVPSNTEIEREILSNEDVDEIANVDENPSTNLVCSQNSDVEENVSSNKGTEGETTSKTDVCSSTTNLVISEVKNVDDIISSGGQMEQEKTSTENVSSVKRCSEVKISISNQSSHVDRNKKRQIKDKKSTQTKTEISSVKSSSRKAPIPEIHPKNQIFKHDPMVSSVNAVKKNTQSLPKSENKRSRPLLDRLVNGNKTVVPKSNSTNHSDASIASTKKPRSVTVPSSFSFKSDERAAKRKQVSLNLTSTKKPRSVTVPSSFSFKSDERAAKRKQFFQKLEENPKLKEKARSDDKKLRWSTAIEAKPSINETRGPSNKLQKIQPTRTSQKLGTKPKNFIELNKKMLSSSMAFLRSRKSHDKP